MSNKVEILLSRTNLNNSIFLPCKCHFFLYIDLSKWLQLQLIRTVRPWKNRFNISIQHRSTLLNSASLTLWCPRWIMSVNYSEWCPMMFNGAEQILMAIKHSHNKVLSGNNVGWCWAEFDCHQTFVQQSYIHNRGGVESVSSMPRSSHNLIHTILLQTGCQLVIQVWLWQEFFPRCTLIVQAHLGLSMSNDNGYQAAITSSQVESDVMRWVLAISIPAFF